MRIDRQDHTTGSRAPVRSVGEHEIAFDLSQLPVARTIARRSIP